jgi:hypothetical protein
MIRQQRLRLEQLEDRLTPATAGFPWPNASHLTISFVPDTTVVGQTGNTTLHSQLSSLFQGIPTSAWQGEILRAFQSWAAVANLNFSVVTDDGEPLGTPGALQGDPRFGDIRIAASPLSPSDGSDPSSELVATSVPFNPTAGTWSGDLLFNPNFTFGIGNQGGPNSYDIYSIAVHEVGHILGFDSTLTDTSSVMFAYYNGSRTGLSASDVAAVQQLYGARRPDHFEDGDGHNPVRDATNFNKVALRQYRQDLKPFEQAGDVTGVLPFSVLGDLTTTHDTDLFSYRTTAQQPDFTVKLLTSDVSLLEARLTVYDDEGHVVQSVVATDPQAGALTIRVSPAVKHDRYFIRVAGAQHDVFGTGAYRLQIVPDNPHALDALSSVWQEFQHHPHTNDTFATATQLRRAAQSAPGHTDFYAEGNLSGSGDVDFYRLRAPTAGGTQSMTVMVWRTDAAVTPDSTPAVTVYDAQGNVVAADVVVNANGTEVVRIAATQPGAHYFIAVRPTGAASLGRYALGVEFNAPAPAATTPVISGMVFGTVGDPSQRTTEQAFGSVELPVAQLLNLTISVPPPDTTATAALEVTLWDQSGNKVLDETIMAGQTLRLTLFLPAGHYTFRFAGGAEYGPNQPANLPAMNYYVYAETLSEPIGPKLIDPNNPPPPAQPAWNNKNDLMIPLNPIDPFGNGYGFIIA